MASRLGRWRAGYAGMACPRCLRGLKHETLRNGEQTCPACHRLFDAVRFDPIEPRVVVPDLAGTGPEGAAPCARHARNQAEAACARCGQFMCALCRIDADQKAYCPGCFDRLSAEGSLASSVTRVRNYAGWAAICLLTSFMFMFAAPITGPLGVIFCIKGLKDKRSRNETDGVGRIYMLLVCCLLTILLGLGLVAGMFGALASGAAK